MLTLMTSPGFTKRGTCTIIPVSRVAGLVGLFAVSPLRPSADSVIANSTVAGRETDTAEPLMKRTSTS